jgi:hypothetical protein
MKRQYILFLFLFAGGTAYSQQKIKTSMVMLIQIQIPIQPDDKSWTTWNIMPSPQDSTKTIRIDRMAQGYAPFIARADAPYYSSSQVNEIKISLEKILNPDLYFSSQEEFMKYYQEFMDKFVFRSIKKNDDSNH